MSVITEILGPSDHPDLAKVLHRLDHAGGLDTLVLPRADLARRRLRATTESGDDIAIALPREQALFDGAVLRLAGESALVVRVEAEHWLRVVPARADIALRLGYFAGNLHWRVRFDGEALLIAIESEAQVLLDRLGPMIDAGEVTCTLPEGVT